MANTSSALALALGAGGGLALWYLLHDNTKSPAPGSAAPVAPAAPAAPAPITPTRQAAPAESSPVQMACTVRLDAAGLTVDGARVGIAEAVQCCELAGLANVTVSKDASAAAYADLMIALGRAGIPASANRNGPGPRNARPRAVDDVDLSAFARKVRSLAEHVEPDPSPDGRARGRFGERKVFIAAIRRALRATKYARLSRAAIDELLLRAHREQLLDLARADLVAAMDPDEVRDSEVTHPMGAHFHFIVIERNATRNADTYRTFTLALYTQGDHVSPRMRWFTADPPTTWTDARDRLAAAGILDPTRANRTRTPGGWILTFEPVLFREERAEPLPGGGSDDE